MMKNLPKIEILLTVFYVLVFTTAFFILFGFRFDQKIAVRVFAGLFCLAPFVIYFGSSNRIAPRLSRIFLAINALLAILFFIPALSFSFILPVPVFIAFWFLVKRELRTGFKNWLDAKNFSPVPKPPREILQTLGKEKSWQCYANSFSLESEREIPYLLWFGTSSEPSTIVFNGKVTQTSVQISHLAISFFPVTVGDDFKAKLESLNAVNQSFWENLKPNSQKKHPYHTARCSGQTFVAAWAIPHIPRLLDEKLSEIKTMLEEK